ncbi:MULTISPECIES: hypothetical protein [unclassified Sporosarcina]|uniref:hypothetical protein n=1 Tax=unclassified Sporosarcina TaxID=2647733 RepID=UPI00164CF533|nr:hypothetical protein [Sporosarcina sp. resist]QNK86769.1 hypothetical protein H7992_16190 [Sporosarcina sp. resist]
MEQDNKLNLLNEKFINGETDQEVEGITIMIDGKFKQTLDIIMTNITEYSNYSEVMRDIIFSGTSQIIESMKK